MPATTQVLLLQRNLSVHAADHHLRDRQGSHSFRTGTADYHAVLYDMMKQNHLLASVILRNALSELCSRYNERKRANMLA